MANSKIEVRKANQKMKSFRSAQKANRRENDPRLKFVPIVINDVNEMIAMVYTRGSTVEVSLCSMKGDDYTPTEEESKAIHAAIVGLLGLKVKKTTSLSLS